jgi:folylpolyglutamate synthase/dihydrofolate synthase
MSYSETVNYLYNLQKYGIKFGLDNISRLMSALDNPHTSFLSVHVAGTNGKGSTSAIIASILKTAGFKVGLFTSPHIISFTERIRVNGEEITESEVVSLTEEIRTRIEDTPSLTLPPRGGGQGWGGEVKLNPTFFEVVTAMALLYFKRKKADIAVIEVGMGGRLDATNIITPEISVITNISYDHKEFLGDTLKEIAYEKTGIIKKGVPVVASYQESEAMKVIEQKAIEKNSELYIYGRDFSSVLKRNDSSGICFDYSSGDSFTINDLVLPLAGEHQMQNASVAIKAVELLSKKLTSDFSFPASNKNLHSYSSPSPTPPIKGGEEVVMPRVKGEGRVVMPLVEVGAIYKPSPLVGEGEGDHRFSNITPHHFIRKGLEDVRWPGRLEIIKEDPPMLIDGAHNPAAAVALSEALKKNFPGKNKRIILVLGIMGDKDVRGIMEPLLPLASEIILTAPAYNRSASPEKLAGIAASLGFFDVRIAPTMKDAVEMATEIGLNDKRQGLGNLPHNPSPAPLILITGSFYTIGEAKEVLGQKGVLARLRE